MTANTTRASASFFGLLLCAMAFPANLAAQYQGPEDFLNRRMTPCDFLKPAAAASIQHGRNLAQPGNQFRVDLRQHILSKSYSVQKECAYDFMRLRRKVVEASVSSNQNFDRLADVRLHPAAYVGRPMVLYGRVAELRSRGRENSASLFALDSNDVLAELDIIDIRTRPRQLPAAGLPVRVVGFLVQTLSGNVPYFCTQKLEWLSVEADPATFNVIRQKTRGIAPEEASTYYETLMRSRILPLSQQQQYANAWLEARIEERFEEAQKVHSEERRQAEAMRVTDGSRAADMVRIADNKLLGERKRHENYLAKPAAFPVFADVFLNPNVYLGKPVTMQGHVRKVMSYPADADRYASLGNQSSSDTLHELWLFTDDSQQNPAVIVCSELPPGFPTTGDEIVEGVSVTGYFFKLYRYTADDANRAAPMLLSHQIQWQQQETTYAGFGSMGTLATVLAMFVGVALLMYMWSNHDGDARAREALATARTADMTPDDRPVRFPSPDLLPPRSTETTSSGRAVDAHSATTTSALQGTQRQILPPPAATRTTRTAHTTGLTSLPEQQPLPREPYPDTTGSHPTSGPGGRTSAPIDPLFRPKETAERAVDGVTDFVGNQASRASNFIQRQKDRAGNFVDEQKDRVGDFVGNQKDRAGDFVDQQKDRAGGFVDQQKDRLARAADKVPFIPLPGIGSSRQQETPAHEPQQPQTPAPEAPRSSRAQGRGRTVPQGDRTMASDHIVGSQILRVLQQSETDPGCRIELSNGNTLTLTNDVLGIDNRVQRGARSDREFSALEGLQIEQVATDQWERVYLIAGRDSFITEDFAENGQRSLIFGSLSALFDEEPELTLSDYWTRATLR